MPDLLHAFGTEMGKQRLCDLLPGLTITYRQFDLNQLVIPQGAVQLCLNRFRQTFLGHSYHRFQAVSDGFEALSVLAGKSHGVWHKDKGRQL